MNLNTGMLATIAIIMAIMAIMAITMTVIMK